MRSAKYTHEAQRSITLSGGGRPRRSRGSNRPCARRPERNRGGGERSTGGGDIVDDKDLLSADRNDRAEARTAPAFGTRRAGLWSAGRAVEQRPDRKVQLTRDGAREQLAVIDSRTESTRAARGDPCDDLALAPRGASSAIAAPEPRERRARVAILGARDELTRATPAYANAATHQSIPGGGGAAGGGVRAAAARAQHGSPARRTRTRSREHRGQHVVEGAGNLHGPEPTAGLRQLRRGHRGTGGSGPPHVARQRAGERRAGDADLGDDRRSPGAPASRRTPGCAPPSRPARRACRATERTSSPVALLDLDAGAGRPCARSIVDTGAAT